MEHPSLQFYNCPLCNGNNTSPVFEVKGFKIVQCGKCAMVYVNPRLSDEVIFKIYEKDYFLKTDYTFNDYGYGNYDLTAHLRDKTFNRWYEKIKPFLKGQVETRHASSLPAFALDVGSATGRFLKILSADGWSVKGIELDRAQCQKLRDEGYMMSNQALELYETKEKHHLITLFDVVEHLPHPHVDFQKLADILDDNGAVVIVTPDIGSFQKKIFGKKWFQLKPREHISYYSRDTFKKLAQQHGLKIVHLSSCGQYADLAFLHHRMRRYGFPKIASLLEKFMKYSGLKNMSWYVDTGSLLVVLCKEVIQSKR